ncbi:hypothetical protein LCGC14_2948710 [marine sediment metagenome]|uniref:Uncharacterized protein n=1 Tax=marine sediment metagenome TaxID=412755 RepID=A0A0F8XGH1_9ZZZZ
MEKDKKIEQIVRNYQKKMQKIVDDSNDITNISIEVGGEKTTIAERRKVRGTDARK